ncbi:MAG: MG2 domain-containing protein, partial [Bacteroidales bacterium]|nr:MG2 domain-containing protein [Bacteroidales bacterium]
MIKKIFLLFTVFTVAACTVFSNPVPENPKYEKLWKKVDSLSKKGLTKSALDVVMVIYKMSKQEKNAPEFVKAVIHKMKFESETDEKFFVTAIKELKSECAQSSFPLKQVLHSILAEVYWNYYQTNRFIFENRTTTVNFSQDDIETWDLKKITEEVILNYKLSLGNPDELKKVQLNIYDIVLIAEKDSKKFRPTLYDFIAHRAVDFFISEEPDLIKPAYKFELDNENYFLPNEKFINEKFVTKDTSSMKYHAVLIFRDLLKFRLKDTDPNALIDADLKRLKFIYSHSVIKNKDSLYLNSIVSLEKQFSGNPSSTGISYEIADFYRGKGELYNPLKSEENKWDFKKASEICETAVKKYPDSEGAAKCRYLLAVILTKNLELITDDVISPDKPSLAYVSYKNVPEIFFRIIKTEPGDYKRISRKTSGVEFVEKYLKEKVFKEWSIKLPDDKDFQTHSVEMKIPELPAGFYVILAGTNKIFNIKNNAVGVSSIWVSDISYINRKNTDGGNEFYLLDRTAGTSLKQVKAEVYYQSFNYKTYEYEYEKGETYTSNDEGYLDIPPSDNSRNFYIEFSKGDDKLYSDYNFYQYKSNYKSDSITRINTILYTDRAIYRPGQIVYYKGIVLETKGEKVTIKTNHKTKVTFYDVNYQKISEADLVTNEYGTFGGSFTAPLSALTGLMHIANENGLVYFSVEEYKRPKFEVSFQPVKGSYKLGESITVKGNAKAYAGSNVDNALVKFRVVRNTYFPYYWNYRYDYVPYDSDEMEIANGTTNTNENGEFTINFLAIPDLSIDKKRNPQFDFKVYADVTDINGETHSSEVSISVSYKSLIAKVEIPAMIDKSDKTKKEFKITTTNLNGEQESSKGNISIYKLKQPDRIFRERKWNRPDKFIMTKDEFYSYFPNDIYDDENNISKWEKGNKVLSFDFDTKQDSLLKLENIGTFEQGQYVAELKTKDKYGEDVEHISNFIIYSSTEKSIPINKADWFTEIKNSGEPGEKAVFIIGTKEKNINILFETESKKKIIRKEWLNFSEEQKLIEIPITEDYRGDFFVHFTFVKNNRVYKHDKKITVPHTNKELEITYETFRNKLLPGQKEEWKLKIKGKNGEKFAAEMLASMYDASLDAFKPHSWNFNIYPSYYSFFSWRGENSFGTEKSVFYNEKWNVYPSFTERKYDNLNWFGFYLGGRNYYSYDALGAGAGNQDETAKSEVPLAQGNKTTKKSSKYRAVACPSFGETESTDKSVDR